MKPTANNLETAAMAYGEDSILREYLRAGADAMRELKQAMLELEKMRPVVEAAVEWDGLGVNAHEDLAAEVCESLRDAVKKYQEDQQ